MQVAKSKEQIAIAAAGIKRAFDIFAERITAIAICSLLIERSEAPET